MTDFLTNPIAYLESTDYDKDGNLVNADILSGKNIVVMIQASWCPHCTSAKPEFQKFANKHADKVFCATIQVDGERDGEKKLSSLIEELFPKLRGYPDYALYKNLKLVDNQITGRKVEHLEKFAEI
jgi:thiol-disulfide isomerase/thioredoxin